MAFFIGRRTDVISSRSNPLLVRLCKLEDKKHRESEALFCLDGLKLLLEAATFGAEIEYILVREDVEARMLSALDSAFSEKDMSCEGTLVPLSASAFDKLSGEKAPEGVITVVKYLDGLHRNQKLSEGGELPLKGRTLMLESIRDPGNLGAIMRSAAAFGIENIIMTDDCADIYNKKTLRSAMGAVFKVSTLKVDSALDALELLTKQGRRTFAAALKGDSLKLGDFSLRETDVFVIGNEGHGLSEKVIEKCSDSVFIPMREGTESLNAAIAASVCMWEISKL